MVHIEDVYFNRTARDAAEAYRPGCSSFPGQQRAQILLAHKATGLPHGLLGGLVDRGEEIEQPPAPVSVCPHPLQQIVVGPASALDVGRQVQQRLGQSSSLDQEQRDEEPPHAAVSVNERMDRLELLVYQGALDEVGEPVALMEESLPGCKSLF